MSTKDNRAKEQAEAQLADVIEKMTALDVAFAMKADTKEESDAKDAAVEDAGTAITETPLAVGTEKRFVILLSTGGPACRITGMIDEHGEPETATLQYQDWFTPWVDLNLPTGEAEDALLNFAQRFAPFE